MGTKKALKEILANLNKGVFNPDRGQPQLAACTTGLKSGGYLGPFVHANDWYSPVHLRPAQILEYVNTDTFEKDAIRVAHWITPSTPFKWLMSRSTAADKCLKNTTLMLPSEIII